MRSFFLAYAERSPIVQTASGQSGTGQGGGAFAVPPARIVQTPSGQSPGPFALSWSHYVFLLGIKNADERSFYEIEAGGQGWSLKIWGVVA